MGEFEEMVGRVKAERKEGVEMIAAGIKALKIEKEEKVEEKKEETKEEIIEKEEKSSDQKPREETKEQIPIFPKN